MTYRYICIDGKPILWAKKKQDTIMKSKFFSVFFHGFPGAVRRFGGGNSSKTRPFLAKEKEQAGVGQWPYSAYICAANGVFRILRGYFKALLRVKEKKKGYFGVSCITR